MRDVPRKGEGYIDESRIRQSLQKSSRSKPGRASFQTTLCSVFVLHSAWYDIFYSNIENAMFHIFF